LSCSTIELVDDDGWTDLLSSLIRDSGFAVMRTEKAGVGDSEGPPCNNLGYDQEVQHHREALEALLERSDIDPDRVFLFGASMGANQAPLIANGHKLAGIMVWGGGAKTWFERMINFDRNALELGGTTATEITEKMKKRSLFHSEYLLRNHTPFEIETNNPGLKGVWSEMIGTAETNHYGRPFAFHWEAQNQNWALAWSQVNSPVVVMYGEYDWVEDSAGHQLIADIVNNSNPGSAQFRIIPKTNHHFSEFASKKDAFEEVNGTKNGANVAYLMMQWMNSKLR
jgi:pimeloyl-ACP methyl ester carboxylesterase